MTDAELDAHLETLGFRVVAYVPSDLSALTAEEARSWWGGDVDGVLRDIASLASHPIPQSEPSEKSI